MDETEIFRNGSRWQNAMACYDRQLGNNGMRRSLNIADLRAAHDAHQPTVVQSVEGAHFLEGKLERIEIAYKRGLRHFGLLHDSDASTWWTRRLRWPASLQWRSHESSLGRYETGILLCRRLFDVATSGK